MRLASGRSGPYLEGVAMRPTKKVRQQLLEQNEGFTRDTSYTGKNFREQRRYRIRNGELHYHSTGKTSWAASRFNKERVADDGQTHRFLRNDLSDLNTDGLE
jgi:hypothetical protein